MFIAKPENVAVIGHCFVQTTPPLLLINFFEKAVEGAEGRAFHLECLEAASRWAQALGSVGVLNLFWHGVKHRFKYVRLVSMVLKTSSSYASAKALPLGI